MKKYTSKKLGMYSMMATTALISHSGNAQILYTDVNPDRVLTGTLGTFNSDTMNIDLNNDGTEDFWLEVLNGTSSASSYTMRGVRAYPLSNNRVMLSGGYSAFFPEVLNSGTPIGPANNWNSVMPWLYLYNSGGFGNWPGKTDNYLGVRIIVSTDTLYGWMRLGLDATSNNLTIKGYAIEDTPNKSIEAGQIFNTTIKANEIADDLQINITKDQLEIRLAADRISEVDQLVVSNILGQQLFRTAKIRQSTKIHIEEKVVIVSITGKSLTYSRKVVVY